MKKRVMSLALALVMALGLLPTAAVGAGSEDDARKLWYYYADAEHTTVEARGLESDYHQGPLHIPGKVRLSEDANGRPQYDAGGTEYAVTRINDFAFYYSADTAKLTSVTIGEGVKEIGAGAFAYCGSLTGITLPESLTKIGDRAFEFCGALERIYIPAGVTEIGTPWEYSTDPDLSYNCNTVFFLDPYYNGDYAPASLTEISVSEDNAHYASHDGVLYNKDMTELIRCPAGKTGDYVIPDGVTRIWPAAFSGCVNLTSLTVPASMTEIAGMMFYHYTNGDGYPEDILTFGSKLTSVTILSPTLELVDPVGGWGTYPLFDCDTMYGYNGSTAETYAAEHDIAFVSLGDAPEAPTPGGSAAVTGVSLDNAKVTLKAGETATLTATVKPDNAANKEVYWTSDNTDTVTVDANGKLTGVKAGTANVTVTTLDGGFSATCAVIVTKPSFGTFAGTLGQADELAWQIKDDVLTVDGSLGPRDMVVAACQDETGRFIGAAVFRSGQREARLPEGCAVAKLFWLGAGLEPMCPCVRVGETK